MCKYGVLGACLLNIVCVGSVVVYTENGALDGTLFTTPRGKTVHAFLGVPYAKPPVGQNRFQEPQPIVDKWEGIRDAKELGSACIQYSYYHISSSDPFHGDEDCLYLNVYTPSASASTKLDVVFYIHGGGFMFGAGRNNPNFIMDDNDIVYVNVNYRLGPFGFLSTEDGVIPGNYGLKDQVEALKWVRSNIEQFGGDRNKITVAGFSAGGASVHLHYLSPLSRDLFQKGISVSGSALCPWVFAENSRSKAHTLARSVGCPTSDSVLLLECLQEKPAGDLLVHLEDLFTPWFLNPFSPFGVVIESNHSEAFLSESPYELLSGRNVKNAPWMISMNEDEGLFPAASFVKNDTLLRDLDENWSAIAPFLLDYNNTVASHLLHSVSEQVRTFYFGNKMINYDNVRELVKMVSDRLFVVGIERAARMQASATAAPVYFYNFAYRGKYSVSDIFCRCSDDLGVSHADDLLYLVKVSSDKQSPLETDGDKQMVKTMVGIWSSYLQTEVPSAGPNITWTPVSPNEDNISYMNISSSRNLIPSLSLDLGNREFWDSLPIEELTHAKSSQIIYVLNSTYLLMLIIPSFILIHLLRH